MSKKKGWVNLFAELQTIVQSSVFTLKAVKRYGITAAFIHYYHRRSKLERVSRGNYRICGLSEPVSGPSELQLQPLVEPPIQSSAPCAAHPKIHAALSQFPGSTVGLATALYLYDLLNDCPEPIDVIIPFDKKYYPAYDTVSLYRLKCEDFVIEQVVVQGIPTTTFERTIADLFNLGASVPQLLKIINLAASQGTPFDRMLLIDLMQNVHVLSKGLVKL